MKRLFSTLIFLLLGLQLFASPAYPGKIRYTQPDGSVVELRLHGDEFGHWATDMDGRILRLDDQGFWRIDFGGDTQDLCRRAAARREIADRGRRGKSGVAFGEKHFLVVLVAFADVPFTISDTRTFITRMLNEKGYSENDAVGSARDYYYENSLGRFEPVFDVYGPVTLSQDRACYGKNVGNSDVNAHGAVAEACELLDDEIDFSRYDNDGDGEVDMVFMYFAGKGENDTGITDYIWPHMWYLTSGGIQLTLDGKQLNMYACAAEQSANGKPCGIGTACHEFGHTLGLPDLYDTNYEDLGMAGGMYNCTLMCTGCYNQEGRVPPYFTIEERIMMGWLDESALEEITVAGDYTLPPVQEEMAYRTSTDMNGEYFVYECRDDSGWDAGLSGHGLMVYHVDRSDNSVRIGRSVNRTAWTIWNSDLFMSSLNVDGQHPCYYVVPSGNPESLCYGFDALGNFDYVTYGPKLPFPGAGKVTSYAAVSWNGAVSEYTLEQIKYAGGKASFTVKYVPFKPELDYYAIKNPGHGIYAAGSSLALELYEVAGRSYDSVQWYFDGAAVSGNSVSLTATGPHTVMAEVLLPGGECQRVFLEITVK